jgi:UDP-N-acetylmuramyl pentapeptide phosphotransferase/UDP-N-acetylglucosamine-1-phosphate transferase
MRRARLTSALLTVAVALLVLAPAASAHSGGGQGWYGETTDKAVTTTMFGVIIFFPLIILVFSLIQWRLDRRKHDRMDAARRRAASVDWRGGW